MASESVCTKFLSFAHRHHHKYIIIWPCKHRASSQNADNDKNNGENKTKKHEQGAHLRLCLDTKYCTLSYKHHTRIYKNIDRINWV